MGHWIKRFDTFPIHNKKHFPGRLHNLDVSDQNIFTAGNHQLSILGTVSLPITFTSFTVSCLFLVIADVLQYAILGFDFISAQQLIIHPSHGILQLDYNVPSPNKKTARSQTHIFDIFAPHNCIPVTCNNTYNVSALSFDTIQTTVHYPSDLDYQNKSIVISSECMQDLDDWNKLNVFFQLVQADEMVSIIYTNTSADVITLFTQHTAHRSNLSRNQHCECTINPSHIPATCHSS